MNNLSITPIWHLEVEKIRLDLQPDSLNDKYYNGGWHIYRSSWTDLLSALYANLGIIYSDTSLYSEYQEKEKIDNILEHWKKKIPLIPPMLIDNGFGRLVPAHRLKVASIFQPDEITFILFDVDWKKITSYFNPQLID